MAEVYGILAEFAEPEPLLAASRGVYAAGYRQLDAFTPFPVEGLADAIGFRTDRVALFTLLGGIAGGALAFAMQWYCNVVGYPIDIGGRPMFSWPAFIPVTFELTVLGAALTAAFAMLALNRLPKPWHPAFNLSSFARASRDRFFLCVLARDPLYNPDTLRELLSTFQPLSIQEAPLDDDEA